MAYIRSTAANKYISAELAYPGGDEGMLRARAMVTGPWESYTVQRTGNCSGPAGTDCWTAWIRSLANGKYVSAEILYPGGDEGMLRARATVIGPWEKFNLIYYRADAFYAMQSQANGKYVSAEILYPGGDEGMLRARATVIGPWEKFNVLE